MCIRDREEIMLFLMAEGSEKYVDLFADDDLRAKLAYLADIFGHLNVFNVSLRGPADTILGATDKLHAFREKLTLWQTQMEEGKVTMFPLFSKEENANPGLLQAIKNHLQSLQTACASYFPDLDTTHYDCIRNPFSTTTTVWQNLDVELQNAAIHLKNDRTLQIKFNDVPVTSF